MTSKQSRPVRANGTDLGNAKLTSFDSHNTGTLSLHQDQIDVVSWLSARSGVHPVSVKAQLDMWAIGGRQ